MPQIFICYSRQSQDIIEELALDIKELERDVWFDRKLTGGQAWWNEILKIIRNCEIFVFALSPESIKSEACKRELKYASVLNKTILPIMVAEGVDIKFLPPDLSTIQYEYYLKGDKQAYKSLTKALKTIPPTKPLPDPLPKPPEVPISYLGKLKEQIVTTETLGFKEQIALFTQLDEKIREPNNINDIQNLLKLIKLLKNRDDLLANVDRKIDTLLTNPKDVLPDKTSTLDFKEEHTKRNDSVKDESRRETAKIPPKFRSTPLENFSLQEVKSMLKENDFFDSNRNKIATGFSNSYKMLYDCEVVYDKASGLMWQQGGSTESRKYKNTKAYITQLNSDKFANYSDWRLPTLEEAMSLIEPKANNNDLYIDSIFDSKQKWIWTSDLYSAFGAWVVEFDYGDCNGFDLNGDYYVRAVR